MMSDEPSPIVKYKMLTDAGFHYPEPWQNYALVVDFLKELTTRSCCNVCQCMSCDALQILRKIGETA
jgi:hypothetical protein